MDERLSMTEWACNWSERNPMGWIGVDLDGTLAYYDKWRGEDHIGEPIWPMIHLVREWRQAGIEVRIFTARASQVTMTGRDPERSIRLIQDWCEQHIGERLPVTCTKDFAMIALWDDRAVRVQENIGWPCCGHHAK